MDGLSRRAILAGTPAGIGALAGCSTIRTLLESTGETADGTSTNTPQPTAAGGVTESAVYPRRIVASNETTSDVFLTVSVSTNDESIFLDTRPILAGDTIQFENVVSSAGTYEVAVETTAGRSATQRWPVSTALSDLSVTLGPDAIEFSQDAYCDPACPPLSNGGSATDLPYYGTALDNPLYYGATFSLRNASDDPRMVHLVIRRRDRAILDHRYRVPDGMVLRFPGIHVSGRFDVRVETDIGTRRHDWYITKERYLTATILPETIAIGCGGSTASFLLVNDHHVPHQVSVRARTQTDTTDPTSKQSTQPTQPTRSGSDRSSDSGTEGALFSETFVVQPGARRREHGGFTGSGHYLLDVRLASGESTTYDWWLCPPRGPTEIRIDEDGGLSVIQLIPAE